MTIPFNALECVDRLTAASISPDHAKAFAKEYNTMANSLIDQLVTQGDLQASEDKIGTQIDSLESKLDARFKEFDTKLESLENKLEANFKEFDTKFQNLETKFDTRFKESDAQFKRLEDKIDANTKQTSEQFKTSAKQADERLNTAIAKLQVSIGGMLFTGISVALGILKLMF